MFGRISRLWNDNVHMIMLIVGLAILLLCFCLADRSKHIESKAVTILYKGKIFKPWQFFIASMAQNMLLPPSVKGRSMIAERRKVHGKSTNKNEEHCREIIERLTNRKFVSIRPNFLKNPETNRNLELDMYCEDMKVAFEYNGVQHYHFIPGGFFHPNGEADFIKQQKRDRFKAKRCKEHGITLFVIPYTVKRDQHEEFIKKCLRSL